jgi:hypothetical protein
VGLLNWFRPCPPVTPEPAPRCAFCADPVEAELDELAADPANATYLCRCPACGQYWGGHGYTPHFRWELTPSEAAKYFPHAFAPGTGAAEAKPGASPDTGRA